MKHSNVPTSPTPTRRSHKYTDGRMEAIAYGVQARLDERIGYSRRVTDETVNVARTLGVADGEIKTWVNQRREKLARDEEKLKSIRTILERVRSNMPHIS